jgi:hypothetical protein
MILEGWQIANDRRIGSGLIGEGSGKGEYDMVQREWMRHKQGREDGK